MLQVYFVTILPVHIFLTLEQKNNNKKKKHGNEISPFEFKLIKNLTCIVFMLPLRKNKVHYNEKKKNPNPRVIVIFDQNNF